MPNSVVLMNVHQNKINGELQIPLSELQSAIGMSVNDNSERLVERLGDSLKIYLLQHIRPTSFGGKPWTVIIENISVTASKNPINGVYKELLVKYSMIPPPNEDIRNFYFNYDAIVHQVITHKILIAIKQDWQQGLFSEEKPTEVGIIELDIPTGKILPFQVSLQQGSVWTGFKAMVQLGIKHIAEGTDHLLFLLTLLLAAIQPVKKKLALQKPKKDIFILNFLFPLRGLGGFSIFKIITAFTIGHSLTLLIGTLQLVNFPSQNIEILIAISILISAIHAFHPIFVGKEIFVAGAFGLIHGLAFADTLTNLELDFQGMALSILGFNIGIELMQLFVIALTIPFLLLLSRTQFYKTFKQVGAIIVAFFACGWLAERIQQKPNFITVLIEKVAENAVWLLVFLAVSTIFAWFVEKRKK